MHIRPKIQKGDLVRIKKSKVACHSKDMLEHYHKDITQKDENIFRVVKCRMVVSEARKLGIRACGLTTSDGALMVELCDKENRRFYIRRRDLWMIPTVHQPRNKPIVRSLAERKRL